MSVLCMQMSCVRTVSLPVAPMLCLACCPQDKMMVSVVGSRWSRHGNIIIVFYAVSCVEAKTGCISFGACSAGAFCTFSAAGSQERQRSLPAQEPAGSNWHSQPCPTPPAGQLPGRVAVSQLPAAEGAVPSSSSAEQEAAEPGLASPADAAGQPQQPGAAAGAEAAQPCDTSSVQAASASQSGDQQDAGLAGWQTSAACNMQVTATKPVRALAHQAAQQEGQTANSWQLGTAQGLQAAGAGSVHAPAQQAMEQGTVATGWHQGATPSLQICNDDYVNDEELSRILQQLENGESCQQPAVASSVGGLAATAAFGGQQSHGLQTVDLSEGTAEPVATVQPARQHLTAKPGLPSGSMQGLVQTSWAASGQCCFCSGEC